MANDSERSQIAEKRRKRTGEKKVGKEKKRLRCHPISFFGGRSGGGRRKRERRRAKEGLWQCEKEGLPPTSGFFSFLPFY